METRAHMHQRINWRVMAARMVAGDIQLADRELRYMALARQFRSRGFPPGADCSKRGR